MSLPHAPRFCAYFDRLEGRHVMRMLRADWVRIQAGDMVQVDLSGTPMAGVAVGSRVKAAVAERHSDGQTVVDVYRYDPKDHPTPINLDRYRVWEHLPPHRDYKSMVSAASTEDNDNMRSFLQDHVFLVKADVDPIEHHLPDLPPESGKYSRAELKAPRRSNNEGSLPTTFCERPCETGLNRHLCLGHQEPQNSLCGTLGQGSPERNSI